MSDAVRVLRELYTDRLTAELTKRAALMELNVDAFLGACAEIKSVDNAIFNLEARLLAQEKRDALLPPGPNDRDSREGNEARD